MKLLVLTSRVPFPLDKGDKLRVYHQLRILSQRHDIHLIALGENKDEAATNALKKHCVSVEIIVLPKWKRAINMLWYGILRNLPFQVAYFYSAKAERRIRKSIQDIQPDGIYAQLIRTAEYVKQTETPNTLDYMDALSIGLKRRMRHASPWMKIMLDVEYKRVEKYERKIFDGFKHHSIITAYDREFIRHDSNEKIHIVPNGVDTSYFSPLREIKKEYDIAFVGNMSYPPNVLAAKFLGEELLPILKKEKPDIQILIAGINPAKEVKKLANSNITISGFMEDIRHAYASSRIFAAPMFIGCGLQNKLMEAMAMEIPCITTPMANEALQADSDSILIAKNAEEFAAHCLSILQDPALGAHLGKTGRQFVIEHFDWERNTGLLEEFLFQ